MVLPIFKIGMLQSELSCLPTCGTCPGAPPFSAYFLVQLVTLEGVPASWLLAGTKGIAALLSVFVSPLEMEQGCSNRLDQSLSAPSGKKGNFLRLESFCPLRIYQT